MGNPQKVVLEMSGGLGNQLFQYATARSFAIDLNADLYLEKKIGFLLDFRYRRNFELEQLGIKYRESNFALSYPFYLERARKVLPNSLSDWHKIQFMNGWILENDMTYINLDEYDRTLGTYWLKGYFQDPRYFSKNKSLLLKEFLPDMPPSSEMMQLKEMSLGRDLIALGIRFYEESENPSFHAKDGKLKKIEDFQIALDIVLSSSINPMLLVFTTKEFNILKRLKVPSDTVFFNSKTSSLSSYEKLRLLSLCKHHVFNNSTFYWWGAFLSQKYFAESEQQIYCSDNFLNNEIALNHWNIF